MVYGIISEFNPFHQGHRYLINSVKKEGDAVICVMSGNFVQRGEPAVFDKFKRAKAALEGGADLIIEIPTVCATQSAQGFADAGVKLLEATGVCESLAFGAECADVGKLTELAHLIKEKEQDIHRELKKGLSFPKARHNIIPSPLLETPNNILALEYLAHTKLKTVAVERIGLGHDSNDPDYSASEIRKTLPLEEIASLKNCESAVLYKLRSMSVRDFTAIDDVTEGLENRLHAAVREATSIEEIYDAVKTKRYTHSRIRRIILRAFLCIDNNALKEPSYLRILGFNEKGRELLSQMKKTATLPIITKYSDAAAIGGQVLQGLKEESRFTDIYNITYKAPRPCGTELTDKMVIL